MKALFIFPVVNNHIETAGHGDQELVAALESMPSPISAARHVGEIKNAFDPEWDVSASFKEGQIPARVRNLGQFNDFAFAKLHRCIG